MNSSPLREIRLEGVLGWVLSEHFIQGHNPEAMEAFSPRKTEK